MRGVSLDFASFIHYFGKFIYALEISTNSPLTRFFELLPTTNGTHEKSHTYNIKYNQLANELYGIFKLKFSISVNLNLFEYLIWSVSAHISSTPHTLLCFALDKPPLFLYLCLVRIYYWNFKIIRYGWFRKCYSCPKITHKSYNNPMEWLFHISHLILFNISFKLYEITIQVIFTADIYIYI